MLQATLLRLDGVADLSPPIIVCNEEHRFLAAEHARQVARPPSCIILEPVGRNTAPALALAALTLSSPTDDSSDPVMLVLPADHVIDDVGEFQSALARGRELAYQECIVTFGVVPTAPRTGYGYIKKGEAYEPNGATPDVGSEVWRLETFVEKPDEARAARMLESGEYLWNSGMFMMRASVWLEQLERFRPDIAEACGLAHQAGELDGDFYRPDAGLFAACPADTIDYAVMERIAGNSTAGGPDPVVVPLDAGWSDVGAWSSFLEVSPQDSAGNVVQGDVYIQDMRDSLVISQHRLVAAVGLENVIVVETADAVLVARVDQVEEVRDLVARLKEEGRCEQENHRRVHRPWGWYETLDSGPGFQVKRLTVNPESALSLQMHHHRAEHWVVVRGTARVTKGDEQFYLYENQSTYVPVGSPHRLENPGKVPLEIIEVQSGSYLGEDDIVRYEDRYDRRN
jgi:mannose-1-phosphate guanylyltransferase/mannose-6-phosphate isomerase